jgi:hypothetical protein
MNAYILNTLLYYTTSAVYSSHWFGFMLYALISFWWSLAEQTPTNMKCNIIKYPQNAFMHFVGLVSWNVHFITTLKYFI